MSIFCVKFNNSLLGGTSEGHLTTVPREGVRNFGILVVTSLSLTVWVGTLKDMTNSGL